MQKKRPSYRECGVLGRALRPGGAALHGHGAAHCGYPGGGEGIVKNSLKSSLFWLVFSAFLLLGWASLPHGCNGTGCVVADQNQHQMVTRCEMQDSRSEVLLPWSLPCGEAGRLSNNQPPRNARLTFPS